MSMPTTRFLLVAAVLVGSAAAGLATAAESCDAAHMPVEMAICKDKSLSALDEEVATAYRHRLSQITRDEAAGLAWDQQQWLRFRAPSCVLPPEGTVASDRLAQATPCLQSLYRDRITALAQRCEVDTKTLVDMAREAAANGTKPYFDKVPKGFVIDQHLVFYVIRPKVTMTESYNLPSANLAAPLASAGLKYPLRGLALCRVEAPDGRWWLAERGRGGGLFYILEKDTVPAAVYDARLRKERARLPAGQ